MCNAAVGAWRLDNKKQPDGTLQDVAEFVSMAGSAGTIRHTGDAVYDNPILRARRVSVPAEIDAGRTMQNEGGLASEHVRSLEFWWDGIRMDVILVVAAPDMPAYESDFAVAYPNAAFEDCKGVVPEWYDEGIYWAKASGIGLRGENRKKSGDNAGPPDMAAARPAVFDVSYRHGHFFAAFDTRHAYDAITRILSVIQLSERAWVPMVFCRCNFADYLQSVSGAMRRKYRDVTVPQKHTGKAPATTQKKTRTLPRTARRCRQTLRKRRKTRRSCCQSGAWSNPHMGSTWTGVWLVLYLSRAAATRALSI